MSDHDFDSQREDDDTALETSSANHERQVSGSYRAWDPDAALNSLRTEKEVHGESDADLTERLLRENAPRAALAIVHLAINATNEPLRFKAAQYVVDRTLGRIQDSNPLNRDDPFAAFSAMLTKEVAQ